MAKLKLVKRGNPHGIDLAYYDPDREGVTNSLLGKFKSCRERCRLHLQGWTTSRIGLSLIFGTIVHAVLERIYLDIQKGKLTELPSPKYIRTLVLVIERQFRKENPKINAEALQDLEIACLMTEEILPPYFKLWNKDLTKTAWRTLEHQFTFLMVVASGETPVRGKMDGTFNLSSADKKTWLLETKTKSRLGERGESNLADILGHELQVNLYLNAIRELEKATPGGVLYNIIRRPTIQKKQSERLEQFRKRLREDIFKRPDFYFIRFRMDVRPRDLDRERGEHEQLVEDFRRWFNGDAGHYKNSDWCENKFGTCEFLQVCSRGDFTGLYKRPTVFRELEDV